MSGGRIWLVVGGIVGAIVIGVGWLMGASPLFTQASLADTQRASVDATNAQLELTLENMKKLDAEKEQLLEQLEVLHETVPAVPNIEDYLDWIARAATATSVSLSNVQVGKPELVTIAEESSAPFSPGLAQNLYLMEVNLNIGGDASQMTAFLEMLQTDGRLQLLTQAQLGFGSSLSGTIKGHIFVVHDPTSGSLAAGADPAEAGAEQGEPGDAPAGDATD
jgi:Tfp pilus assembly protein PilO